jgi:hypothetical protein
MCEELKNVEALSRLAKDLICKNLVHIAIEGRLDTLLYMCDHGAKKVWNMDAIMPVSALYGHVDIISYLFDCGCTGEVGWTIIPDRRPYPYGPPIRLAAQGLCHHCIKLFLTKNVDCNDTLRKMEEHMYSVNTNIAYMFALYAPRSYKEHAFPIFLLHYFENVYASTVMMHSLERLCYNRIATLKPEYRSIEEMDIDCQRVIERINTIWETIICP